MTSRTVGENVEFNHASTRPKAASAWEAGDLGAAVEAVSQCTLLLAHSSGFFLRSAGG
jgi:hypothetical protein